MKCLIKMRAWLLVFSIFNLSLFSQNEFEVECKGDTAEYILTINEVLDTKAINKIEINNDCPGANKIRVRFINGKKYFNTKHLHIFFQKIGGRAATVPQQRISPGFIDISLPVDVYVSESSDGERRHLYTMKWGDPEPMLTIKHNDQQILESGSSIETSSNIGLQIEGQGDYEDLSVALHCGGEYRGSEDLSGFDDSLREISFPIKGLTKENKDCELIVSIGNDVIKRYPLNVYIKNGGPIETDKPGSSTGEGLGPSDPIDSGQEDPNEPNGQGKEPPKSSSFEKYTSRFFLSIALIIFFGLSVYALVIVFQQKRFTNDFANSLYVSLNYLRPMNDSAYQNLEQIVSDNEYPEKLKKCLLKIAKIARAAIRASGNTSFKQVAEIDEHYVQHLNNEIDNNSLIQAQNQGSQFDAFLDWLNKSLPFNKVVTPCNQREALARKQIENLCQEHKQFKGFANQLAGQRGEANGLQGAPDRAGDSRAILERARAAWRDLKADNQRCRDELAGAQRMLGRRFEGMVADAGSSGLMDGLRRLADWSDGQRAEKAELERSRQKLEAELAKLCAFFQLPAASSSSAATGDSLESRLRFLETQEAWLPDFLKRFRALAEAMAADLRRLKQRCHPESDFQELLSIALAGPGGRSGPVALMSLIGEAGRHDALLRSLGYERQWDLAALRPDVFFHEILDRYFLDSLHAFFQLALYKDIEFEGFRLAEDMRADRLDLSLLESIRHYLESHLKALFDLSIVQPKLFQETFDPDRHDLSNQPTLNRFALLGKKYRELIHRLPPRVIYDISGVGLKSESLQLNVKPKLVFKQS